MGNTSLHRLPPSLLLQGLEAAVASGIPPAVEPEVSLAAALAAGAQLAAEQQSVMDIRLSLGGWVGLWVDGNTDMGRQPGMGSSVERHGLLHSSEAGTPILRNQAGIQLCVGLRVLST
mgnify:CR=1 FL=1